MKIEFKKIPQEKKEFNTSLNSVKIEGTFCRISSSLVKIEASLIGNIEIDCSRCGALDTLVVNEELKDALNKIESYLLLDVGRLLYLRLLTAKTILKASLKREKSLGAHFIKED